jgi:cystathionine beta-lyase/cystathionine gamma-synthase
MGAIAALLLDRLRPGDAILAGRELYGKTAVLLNDRLARFGVNTEFVDVTDLPVVEVALKRRPKLVWLESLSNPWLRAAPIDRLADLVHKAGAFLAVDNTFSPPPILSPIKLGADIVMHSLTKIVSGHSDVTLGCLVGKSSLIESVAATASTFGFHAAAFDSWLTERGLATLALRAERASSNALELAEFLEGHKAVRRVHYPGLRSHQDHDWMQRHSKLFGYMLSIELAGGRSAVNELFRGFGSISFCPSLGDVCTTVSHPATTSHRSLTAEQRGDLGIHDGLVRVSVGIEPVESIIADFRQALESCSAK